MGTGYFFGGTPMDFYEREMRKPPGYFRRGQGVLIMDQMDWRERGSYEEIVDIVITRMQMEHLKQRIEKIFHHLTGERMFHDEKHRRNYEKIMAGKRAAFTDHRPNYVAAVFLLSVDEVLWNIVKSNVLDTGIYFDRVRLGGVTLEQYILFHAAKDVYQDSRHVRLSELADKRLIPDDILKVIVNAFVIRKCGIEILEWES